MEKIRISANRIDGALQDAPEKVCMRALLCVREGNGGMGMPEVSVVIPVYNVEEYLRECLDSVATQTLRDIEIICVDDGSTDACPDILDEYAAMDSRIRVIHKPNGGYGHAVNTGMDAAGGTYFAIVESDDRIDAKMYETLVQAAREHDADVVKADFCRFVSAEGGYSEEYANIAQQDMYGRVLTHDGDLERLIQKAHLYTWSGIYRMDFLRRNRIRHNETPGASYQDNGFWFRTMTSAERVFFLDQAFYRLRRDNPNSSIRNRGKVYCIRDEYDLILAGLKEDPVKYRETIQLYWWARYGAYQFCLRRIAPEYRREFILHFSEVFCSVWGTPELNRRHFNAPSWHALKQIVRDPMGYFRAYSDGEARTGASPSVIRRLLWCYQDNGLRYTIRRAAGRIRKKLGRK